MRGRAGRVTSTLLWAVGFALAFLLCLAPPAHAQKGEHRTEEARSEKSVAGLQPGQDGWERAVRVLGYSYFEAYPNTPDLVMWADPQKHIYLRIELTEDRTINTITVSSYGPGRVERKANLPLSAASTGKGLKLGDSLEKELDIYGEPYFKGPSSEGGRDLTLVVHKFNVSEDLPQVMETSFDPRTGKLVKISLSFPYY